MYDRPGPAPALDNPEYLGDGVFIGNDGQQVWIWISDGQSHTRPIALDPSMPSRIVEHRRKFITGTAAR